MFKNINIEAVFGIVATVLSIILTPLLKNKKAQKIADITLKIMKKLPTMITIAEKISGFTGAQKKAYVMEQVQEILNDKNIKIDVKIFDDELEKLICMSKNVNVKQSNAPTPPATVKAGEIYK